MAYSSGSYWNVSSNDTSHGRATAAADASYRIYDNLTVGIWVAGGSGNNKHICSLWDQVSGAKRSWLMSNQTDGGLRMLASWDGTNFSNIKTPAGSMDFSWKLWVWTFASGAQAIYGNAVSQTLTTTTAWTGGTAPMFTSTTKLMFGGHSEGTPPADTSPGCAMNNFTLWNKVLSQAEITELYNNGMPFDPQTHSASGNLTNHFRMDQSDTYTGTGSTLVDSKNSAANAILTFSGTSGKFTKGTQYQNAGAYPRNRVVNK